MGLLKEYLFTKESIKEVVEFMGDDFEVEFRVPLWKDAEEAERRALDELKNIITRPIVDGVVGAYSSDDQALLDQRTRINLAKICVLRVAERAAPELGNWDGIIPELLQIAIGKRVEDIRFLGVKGLKNWRALRSPSGTGRKLRKLKAPQHSREITPPGA